MNFHAAKKKDQGTPERHVDALGQPLEIGDTVAVSYNNTIRICMVNKVTPKMVRVMPVKANYRGNGYLKYGYDMVAVDPQLVTLYALKN